MISVENYVNYSPVNGHSTQSEIIELLHICDL